MMKRSLNSFMGFFLQSIFSSSTIYFLQFPNLFSFFNKWSNSRCTYDLSVGSTETKYIKLKTKPQNNIVIFGFFHEELYYYVGFFCNNLTKKTSFLFFLFFSTSTIQKITHKGGFFQRVQFVFQISKLQKNIPNHYPELGTWNSRP